jgi:hypothetical protein
MVGQAVPVCTGRGTRHPAASTYRRYPPRDGAPANHTIVSVDVESRKPLVVGAALFGVGAIEALRLGRGDVGDARRSARSTGGARVVAGSVLLARPQAMPWLLGSPAEIRSALPWLGRMLAIRELVLGVATLRASRPGEDPRPWLLVLALVDTGEAAVLLDALRRGTVRQSRGSAFVLADLGSALAGAGVLRQLRSDRRLEVLAAR